MEFVAKVSHNSMCVLCCRISLHTFRMIDICTHVSCICARKQMSTLLIMVFDVLIVMLPTLQKKERESSHFHTRVCGIDDS